MAIASMIVQPANDAVDRVIAELTGIFGVTVHTTTPNNQIIVVVEAPSLDDVNFSCQDHGINSRRCRSLPNLCLYRG